MHTIRRGSTTTIGYRETREKLDDWYDVMTVLAQGGASIVKRVSTGGVYINHNTAYTSYTEAETLQLTAKEPVTFQLMIINYSGDIVARSEVYFADVAETNYDKALGSAQ